MSYGSVHVLMIEDSAADAELVEHELSKTGLEFDCTRVEANDEFLTELRQHPPQLVLSDNGLPSFDGLTVLTMVRERYPDVPFIFVTGGASDDRMTKALENGATDYVLKQHLSELGPAVRRALRETEERKLRRGLEAERDYLTKELQIARTQAKHLSNLLHICSGCRKLRDDGGEWLQLEEYFERATGTQFSHGMCPDCVQKYFTGYV
jgi:DNA-binding response OmpR family regulator